MSLKIPSHVPIFSSSLSSLLPPHFNAAWNLFKIYNYVCYFTSSSQQSIPCISKIKAIPFFMDLPDKNLCSKRRKFSAVFVSYGLMIPFYWKTLNEFCMALRKSCLMVYLFINALKLIFERTLMSLNLNLFIRSTVPIMSSDTSS